MNYRANIVIFHEIVPLSARSSKKEDAKRGTAAREMAKTDRKTGGIRGCNSWHLLFRSAANRSPPEVRKRAGSGRSARRAPQRNRAAQSPSRPCARSRNAVPSEKEGANDSGLGHFFDLSGSFSPIASIASEPHAYARSKGGETGEKAPARTRAHHRVSVFRLHPSAVIRWFTTRYE